MSTVIVPSDCVAVKPGAPLPETESHWDKRKIEAVELAALLLPLPHRHKVCRRLLECAKWLGFARRREGWKLTLASFCHVRLCPVCQMRRSRKWLARFFQKAPVMQMLYPEDRFLLLSLTVRNCEPEDLRKTLKAMSDGWMRLTKTKNFRAVRGFIRATEVTLGCNDTAHHSDLSDSNPPGRQRLQSHCAP